MSAPALRRLPERTALPGALDRAVLASAVGFALDSTRRGRLVQTGYETVPTSWFTDEALVWQQNKWIGTELYALDAVVLGAHSRDEAPDCGTGCCIAGWIDLHSPDRDPADRSGSRDTAAAAMRLLIGYAPDALWAELPELPGLPDDVPAWAPLAILEGTMPDVDDSGTYGETVQAIEAVRRDPDHEGYLFAGGNDLREVFTYADQLLRLYGEEPLRVSPNGTVW